MAGRKKVYGTGLFVWGGHRTLQDYKSLQEKIDHLTSLDLLNESTRTIRQILNDVGEGYLVRRVWSQPITTYRASRQTDHLAPWDKLDELWAPPANVAAQGRFNDKGEPVLYVSSDPITALWEVQSKPNEYRVILVLKQRPPLTKIYMAQLGLNLLPKTEDYRGGFGDVLERATSDPEIISYTKANGIHEYWRIQNKLLIDVCTKEYQEYEKHYYRLTSAVGRQLMNIERVEGIQYPSIARSLQGINIAISTNVAKRELEVIEAWLVQIDSLTRESYANSPGTLVVAVGRFGARGEISWSPIEPADLEMAHRQISPRRSEWKNGEIVLIS